MSDSPTTPFSLFFFPSPSFPLPFTLDYSIFYAVKREKNSTNFPFIFYLLPFSLLFFPCLLDFLSLFVSFLFLETRDLVRLRRTGSRILVTRSSPSISPTGLGLPVRHHHFPCLISRQSITHSLCGLALDSSVEF
ncbi:hypothetical protein BDV26DRAFT_185208 [Aspergillus bertholletiae]|uniref:Transmembrane protein n=1 Tax=Aspergillus bertholletiae TaxID=1226010 RepID=A0A5N7BAE0_9EURO|nr:hypothetical protein BDV26DRAFT_185208 [Aspergillus bertholletiae]